MLIECPGYEERELRLVFLDATKVDVSPRISEWAEHALSATIPHFVSEWSFYTVRIKVLHAFHT